MKKLLLFAVICIVALFVADWAYKTYRLHYLTGDRAVLYVYFNVQPNEIPGFFGLDEQQLERISGGYNVRTVIPGYEYLHLVNNRTKQDLNTIDCSAGYDFDSQLEVKQAYDSNYKLNIELSDKKGSKISTKEIYLPWDFGKVNHLIIENNKHYKYCSN